MTFIVFLMGICIGAIGMMAFDRRAAADEVLAELRTEINNLRNPNG